MLRMVHLNWVRPPNLFTLQLRDMCRFSMPNWRPQDLWLDERLTVDGRMQAIRHSATWRRRCVAHHNFNDFDCSDRGRERNSWHGDGVRDHTTSSRLGGRGLAHE